MEKYIVDGQLFKKLVINGATSLKNNYKEVDALNVFPVPDGDTGTNMKMTIEAGASEIANLDENNIGAISKILSRGMLMGARGNSGVILSQLFRGIYKGLTGYETVNAVELGRAFVSGVEQAYHAVLKPVEGTILTVAKDAANKALSMVDENTSINDYFKYHLEEARASLERTPELLEALKRAGVVDSGGAGYVYIIEGMDKAINGIEIEPLEATAQTATIAKGFNAHSDLVYGYCTEFILQLQHKKVNIATFDEKVITEYLTSLGDSIVSLKDEDIVKVHVHTKTPGKVLEFCQQFGEFVTIKIENMSVQHSDGPVTETPSEECNCPECVENRKNLEKKKIAVVAVASGDGLVKVFKKMGVDYVVEGGQSMNPSAEDFVKGFDELNAEHIIVFPNNSNIVLTAQQAGKYYKNATIHVVPSKTLAQGYSALTMLDLSSGDVETILSEIQDVISNVETGLITYSIRDALIGDVSIKEGDYIGIHNGKIVTSKATRIDAVKGLLEAINPEEKEIITIIYGKDVDMDELNEFIKYLEENHSNLEVDTVEGNQDIYHYIISIE